MTFFWIESFFILGLIRWKEASKMEKRDRCRCGWYTRREKNTPWGMCRLKHTAQKFMHSGSRPGMKGVM